MVCVRTLEALQEHYNNRLQGYVKNHPGEFVLLEMEMAGIKETFYGSKRQLDKATEKYKGTFGPGVVAEEIPVRTHRFNKDKKTLEFRVNEHITVCPNDNETKLVGESGVTIKGPLDNEQYTEWAYCPDCYYKVVRRPSESTILHVKNKLKDMKFAKSNL